MDQTKANNSEVHQQIINPEDSDWNWPQFPLHAERNYSRPGNQRFSGWEGDFLNGLMNTGVVRSACFQARVSYNVAKARKKADPEFSKAWNEALEMASDAMIAAAFQRAVFGVTRTKKHYNKGQLMYEEKITEYSDSLLWKLIQAARPEEFGDKVSHNFNINILRQASEKIAAEKGQDPEAVFQEVLRMAELSE